ncbi:hypothetical protein VVAX_02276 [Variovorax paradoxus]|uniref:Uncharacterized protein n=1 Tax=Variovorax paradoxus TaxID=34073 RepID=A0A679JC19_VARPD|nr:hypothetical protein VVAX_02276 [Variovorax paradoxus]
MEGEEGCSAAGAVAAGAAGAAISLPISMPIRNRRTHSSTRQAAVIATMREVIVKTYCDMEKSGVRFREPWK